MVNDMKIIICDDSKKDRTTLKKLLKDYEQKYNQSLEIVEHDSDMDMKDRVLEFQFVEGRVGLRADDIIYIETSRHKNIFHTKNQVYSIYKKLDEIEQELKDMGFVRAHLSFIVNMRYIEKISSYILRLTDGKEISVPRSRYREVKRQYALFKGIEYPEKSK